MNQEAIREAHKNLSLEHSMKQEQDIKIVKASFSGCPVSDRKLFYKSNCLVPISVGQKVHEGKKILATIKLINSSFKTCTILVDDSVQRHTMKIMNPLSEEIIYRQAIQEGDQWLNRNKQFLELITIPKCIMRWDEWLNDSDYAEKYEKVDVLYKSDKSYQQAFHKNIEEFLFRYRLHINEKDLANFDYDYAYTACVEYLKEECSVMCLWVKGEYEFELYPSGRNHAMSATYQKLIQPFYPHLLKSVSLRFKKYPSKASATKDITEST